MEQLQSELAVRCQSPAFVRAALVRYLQGKQWSAIQHVICGHSDGGARVALAMVENKVVLALGDRDKRISLTDLPEYGAVPPGAIAIPRCKTAFVTSAGPLRTHATVRNHDVDGPRCNAYRRCGSLDTRVTGPSADAAVHLTRASPSLP